MVARGLFLKPTYNNSYYLYFIIILAGKNVISKTYDNGNITVSALQSKGYKIYITTNPTRT